MTEITQPYLDEAAQAAGYINYADCLAECLPYHDSYSDAAQSVQAHAATLQELAAYRKRVEAMAAELSHSAKQGLKPGNDWRREFQLIDNLVRPFLAPKPVDPFVEVLKSHLTMGTEGWSDTLWNDMAKSMRRDMDERGMAITPKESGE